MKDKFGEFGGIFVPEILIPALEDLESAFDRYKKDKKFNSELNFLLKEVGSILLEISNSFFCFANLDQYNQILSNLQIFSDSRTLVNRSQTVYQIPLFHNFHS